MNKFCIEVSNDDLLIDVDYENAEVMVLGILQAIKLNPELKDILVAVIELEEELEEYDDEELLSVDVEEE